MTRSQRQHVASEIKEDLHELMNRLRQAGEPYVLATVVRTISVTAAKAGAKAVIYADGSVAGGWIGGGCARSAVLNAAETALSSGEARLISIQPAELLKDLGVAPGEMRDGVRFARNMCPSQGTMDIFIEPVLPRPSLVVLGASPVAVALAGLGARVGFDITVCAPGEHQKIFDDVNERIDGYALPVEEASLRFLVVATQGQGDQAALKAAVSAGSEYVAFVGSRKKAAALREKLVGEGVSAEDLARVKAPAGLDLGAITPEEIALSILAEIFGIRRKGQRAPSDQAICT